MHFPSTRTKTFRKPVGCSYSPTFVPGKILCKDDEWPRAKVSLMERNSIAAGEVDLHARESCRHLVAKNTRQYVLYPCYRSLKFVLGGETVGDDRGNGGVATY